MKISINFFWFMKLIILNIFKPNICNKHNTVLQNGICQECFNEHITKINGG